jgi:UDP-GlcNAc3NAcA epimerase
MKKIISVVGARPQFIKHAPMQLQLQKHFNSLTIHTGQHYDENMSQVFFEELKIPKPDYLFDVQGNSLQGAQTALMLTEIEKACIHEKPDALLVYGDTNSTLAATLVGAKMHIPLVHIEAGLRSYNRLMPEEVNRIIADQLAYMLFCPSNAAIENLKKEGISHQHIYRTGDVMCDILRLIEPTVKPIYTEEPYYFVTIHRPYNTDDINRLTEILSILNQIKHRVIFSIHPRTTARLISNGIDYSIFERILFIPPTSYSQSVAYQKYAECIITDSGGMQKEAYMLGKKCITLRSETEWIETVYKGWNTLVFEDLTQLPEVLNTTPGTYEPTLYGDGHAAEHIVEIMVKNL